MKQTQRAKDYPVIGELARRLPPELELELTTDPDRILALAERHGAGSDREVVRTARARRDRAAVVSQLAQELDRRQREDRARVEAYQRAARPYLRRFREQRLGDLPLETAHERVVRLAEDLLPRAPGSTRCRC